MKNFKIGAEIETKEDVKNLILNIISRAKEFAQIDIVRLTKNYIQGSKVRMLDDAIEQMVAFTIYDLQIAKKVVCIDGVFYQVKHLSKEQRNECNL